jgi:hypothetical protein
VLKAHKSNDGLPLYHICAPYFGNYAAEDLFSSLPVMIDEMPVNRRDCVGNQKRGWKSLMTTLKSPKNSSVGGPPW